MKKINMKKSKFLFITIASMLLFVLSFSAPIMARPEKVTICHIPPGQPYNARVIKISRDALQTHLDLHGDYVTSGSVGEKCVGD